MGLGPSLLEPGSELLRTPTVRLTLHRGAERTPVGLSLFRDRKRAVVIHTIDEGSLVARWNAENPVMKLVPHDRVLQINGKPTETLEWDEIAAESKKDTIELQVQFGAAHAVYENMPLRRVLPANLLSPYKTNRLPQKFVDEQCCRDCAICLEEMKDGQKLVVLPCGHAFHHSCCHRWMFKDQTQSGRCPCCRQQIPSKPTAAAEPALGAKGEAPVEVSDAQRPETPSSERAETPMSEPSDDQYIGIITDI